MGVELFTAGISTQSEGLGNIFNKVGKWFVKTFDKEEQRERDAAVVQQDSMRTTLIAKVGKLSDEHILQTQQAKKQCDAEINSLQNELNTLLAPPTTQST